MANEYNGHRHANAVWDHVIAPTPDDVVVDGDWLQYELDRGDRAKAKVLKLRKKLHLLVKATYVAKFDGVPIDHDEAITALRSIIEATH